MFLQISQKTSSRQPHDYGDFILPSLFFAQNKDGEGTSGFPSMILTGNVDGDGRGYGDEGKWRRREMETAGSAGAKPAGTV